LLISADKYILSKFVHTSVYHGTANAWDKNSNSILKILGSLFIIFVISFSDNNNVQAQNIEGISKYDTSLMRIHSPAKASFYSAVLPGLGQAYNKKYWKIPILYAGSGTLIYFINFHNTHYLRYKKAYILRVANDPNNEDEFKKNHLDNLYTDENLKYLMDTYRRWRDLCVFSLAGVYLANIIDATVDAYLFDYDVSQDLSLHIEPAIFQTPSSTSLGLSCKFTF
jgi:hypothetical protein